jgi:hypothetical protein
MGNEHSMTPVYWVIWMPAYVHTNIEDKPKKIIDTKENISDNKSYTQKITAKLDRKDIVICFSACTTSESDRTSKTEIKEDAYVIKLKYIDNSSNGLFLYECECVTNDEVTRELVRKPRHATIHLLKSLYHNHIFHLSSTNANKDFYFDVYIANSQPDVKDVNNTAIMHYVRKIEERFSWAVELFETSLSKFTRDKTNKEQIYKEYNYYLGESLFTNALCCSKYVDTKGEDNDDVRKMLFNIENLKTYISFIRDYHRLNLDEQWANKSLKRAIIGIWISVIFSGVSLCYAFYSSRGTEKQINNIEEILQQGQNHVDSLFLKQPDRIPIPLPE